MKTNSINYHNGQFWVFTEQVLKHYYENYRLHFNRTKYITALIRSWIGSSIDKAFLMDIPMWNALLAIWFWLPSRTQSAGYRYLESSFSWTSRWLPVWSRLAYQNRKLITAVLTVFLGKIGVWRPIRYPGEVQYSTGDGAWRSIRDAGEVQYRRLGREDQSRSTNNSKYLGEVTSSPSFHVPLFFLSPNQGKD